MQRALAIIMGIAIAAVLPTFVPSSPNPSGPIFGPSYVVTDVQTLNGQTINGVVPKPYVVGTYVHGGDPNQVGVSQPCPLGNFREDPGNPASAASTLDYRWVHQYGSFPAVVWDLGSPYGAVVVFPNIDHAPFPQEGIEYTVWGSPTPNAPFPGGWTLGTLSAIYTKGWVDNPNCPSTESDDWAGEYTFGFQTFRYVAAYSSESITIFNDPSHASWSGTSDDDPSLPGWQSTDMEIDGVGAPVCAPGFPNADAGADQVVHVNSTVRFDGSASTGNVSLYGWDTDGDKVIDLTGPSPMKTFTAPFDGDVTLTVVDNRGCSASDAMHLSVVVNRAPTMSSFTATGASEGSPVTFSAAATDPDGDPLTYAFDFDGDGTFDVNGTSPTASQVFGDDFAGTATVRVSDGRLAVDATAAVVVANVPPALAGMITATARVDVTLRVAGEKWHDVTVTLFNGSTPVATASVVRVPGSPDDQAVTIRNLTLDVLGDAVSAVVTYTPLDDPVNGQVWGADPAWLILRSADGHRAALHHTFNVRHLDTWTWTVPDLRALLVGIPMTFLASAHDPGSDDLTFTWSWGDGTVTAATFFNNGVSPDPYPSTDVNPIAATDVATHAYGAPGTYTVTLTVRDDDGGSAQVQGVVSVG